jgi:hypothetical protein
MYIWKDNNMVYCSTELYKFLAFSLTFPMLSFIFTVEDSATDDRPYMKRGNSSSTDSPNGNSNNDSSPCTSDTG